MSAAPRIGPYCASSRRSRFTTTFAARVADNTLRRIVKGLKRYVIDCPDPYIVQIGQTGFGGDGRQYATGAPLTTVTSKAEHLLIEPFAVKCNHTSNRTKYDCFRGQSGRLPLQTVT